MEDELLMISKNLMILSQMIDPEEQQHTPPGYLADAVYSVAQHIERLADSVWRERRRNA